VKYFEYNRNLGTQTAFFSDFCTCAAYINQAIKRSVIEPDTDTGFQYIIPYVLSATNESR